VFWSWLAKHKLVVFGGALCAVAAGGLIEVLEARSAGVADWYMDTAMWILVWSWYVLAGWSLAVGRRVRGTANVVILELLSIFWITILISRIPPDQIVVGERLVAREALNASWLSVVLLALAGLVMLVMAIATTRADR